MSKPEFRECFWNVLAQHFTNPEELPFSAVSKVLKNLITKLCNTQIQEFLDYFKHTAASKQGDASVSGQNLCDKLLTHHVNLKTSTTIIHEI